MTVRRTLSVGSSVALALLLLAQQDPRELAGRVRSLRHYASQWLPVRRLGGSSTDFDRDYFLFLERARSRVPAGSAGIAVLTDRTMPSRGVYLTVYDLAPTPVLVDPDRVPPGWATLVYRTARPEGRPLVAELPNGAVFGPVP